MKTVTSADGTAIAYEQEGQGPALILVDGALCARGSKADLGALLAPDFTVYRYDRRGRGDSGDTQPYAAEREIEDLLALIGAAGGVAFLCGHSWGCALVMDTVLQTSETTVPEIALYEAPYNDGPAVQASWKIYLRDFMRETARTLSAEMPHSRLRVVEGQTHEVDPAVLAPVLAEFFTG